MADRAAFPEGNRAASPEGSRSAPNWGQTAPIAELEGAITLLNQLRAEPRHGDHQWENARTAAYKKAGRLLNVQPSRLGKGSSRWNPTIDALDHYRADWRGLPFFTLPEALAYVGHKNLLPPGFAEADLEGLVMRLGGDRYQLSQGGWAEFRRLSPAAQPRRLA